MKITDFPKYKEVIDNQSDRIIIKSKQSDLDLYLHTMYDMYHLGSRGRSILKFIVHNYNRETYEVVIDASDNDMGIVASTYYRALSKLLEQQIIFRSTKSPHIFFLSPEIAPYRLDGTLKDLVLDYGFNEEQYSEKFRDTFNKQQKHIEQWFDINDCGEIIQLNLKPILADYKKTEIVLNISNNTLVDNDGSRKRNGIGLVRNMTAQFNKQYKALDNDESRF